MQLVIKKDFLSFPDKKEELKGLASNYKNLVVTPKTLQDAKKARLVLREERYSIQKIELHNKTILNELKRKNKLMAEELIKEIKPTEDTIHESIKRVEDQLEAERERKRKEREARREHQRLAALSLLEPLKVINAATTLDVVIDELNKAEVVTLTKKEYGEYYEAAVSNNNAVISRAKERIDEIKTILEAEHQKAISEYMVLFGEEPKENLSTANILKLIEEKKAKDAVKDVNTEPWEPNPNYVPNDTDPTNVEPSNLKPEITRREPKTQEKVVEVYEINDAVLLHNVYEQIKKVEVPEFDDEQYRIFGALIKENINELLIGIETFKSKQK